MIRNNRKRFFITTTIVCLIVPLFIGIGQVYASPPENALKKFEAYGLYNCMRDQFKRSFTQEEVEEDFFNDSTSSLMKSGDKESVSLPAGSDLRGANNYKINCTKLTADLIGANSYNENPYGSFVELLEKFGYNKQNTASGSSKCKIYKFKATQYVEGYGLYGSWHPAGAIEYCESSVNSSGVINNDSQPTYKVLYGNYLDPIFKKYDEDWEPYIGYLYRGDSSKITYCFNHQTAWHAGEDCSKYDDEDKVSVSRSGSWETVSSNLDKEIKNLFITNAKEWDDPYDALLEDIANSVWLKYDGSVDGSSNSSTANSAFEYKITNVLQSFKKAYKNIWSEDFSSYKFSKSQQAGLYQNYILSYWKAETEACADTKTASEEAGKDLVKSTGDDDGYYHQTKLYKSDGTAQYCYVKTAKWGDQVYGITDTQVPSSTKIGFAAVAKWLLDNGPSSIDTEDIATSVSDPGGDSNGGEVTPTCMNSGGAGSLGWIVCSILDWMSNATTDLYENTVKPALEVKPSYFENDTTRKAWNTFQNIANVAFVIMVLIVIFSQLTGFGIDNYGIKKILPKLIVAAVLINLSYLICVICIDLSNILGNGLQGFLDGLSSVNSQDITINSNGSVSINVAADVGIVSVGILSAVVLAYAIYSNPALLLTLFVAAIGVLISVLFIFILLAGREALIILLTVVSPVAFVLYMLPNTKKIFDKWLKLWEAMLFLYPICGLLIGGGNFASALILNTTGQNGGAATVFTALIIGIVPIFFIPTMLKGAFAAMGSIGNTISGFGKRLSSGATSRIKNAESYKNAQERSAERQKRKAAQRRAGVYIDKDGNVKQSRRPSARLRRKVAGTWVGGKLGMDTNMGKNTKAFLQQEAARRGNSESMDLDSANAVFAGVQAKEAKQRIEDQETLITNGKARLKNGNTVNASSADSVALYHQEMLEEAHRAKKSGDNAGYAAAMDRAKAAQNILSKTDSGRGHVQANLEGAISAGHTSGLSEAAGHLLDNYGDKYKTANRGAHGLISDLAVATTDAQGNLTVAEKDSSGKLVDVKLADKVSSRTYDTKGTDKYTAETLAGADESALERLENSFTGKAGAPTMSAAQKAEIAKTAYEALNNPNIHVKPEVENRLRTLSAGYTPPTSPEEAHRTRLEAQNQEIIDQQRSVAQTNHQIFAQRQGKNPVTGTYPVPNGYTADPSRPGIYTDGKGSTYNSTNNTFS